MISSGSGSAQRLWILFFVFSRARKPDTVDVHVHREQQTDFWFLNKITSSYERAADDFNCLNDPQIIANWNQTVIYVAHFIRNKSMMHAVDVQFNLINSYKRWKGRYFPSERSVCAQRSGGDMYRDAWRVRSVEICFYLLRAPLNDSCHSSKRYISRRRFLTVINCFWFPYLIRIFVGNGCSNHLMPGQWWK